MFRRRVLQRYSTRASQRGSGHAEFYSSLLPAMIPVALLGSAVYMGLHLIQSRLAHEKFLDEANERIRALEQEVDSLQAHPPAASHNAPLSPAGRW